MKQRIIEQLLEKYAFSTGNAFIVLGKDIPALIDDYEKLQAGIPIKEKP